MALGTAKITKESLQVPTDWVEVGDLTNEIGKRYIKGLDNAIKDGAKLNKDRLYFIVKTEKDPANLQNIHISIGITDQLFRKKYENMDYWEYDYKKEKKSLLWSIPHKIDMKNFLRAEHKYSKDLIRWIKEYLKDHPEVNINDKSCVVMK